MLAEGQQFADRFTIESFAGAGGMGQVYRALDAVTGQNVALKLLPADGDGERFVREATLMAGLAHPAFARYVTHGSSADGRRYLAMEWLEGDTLSQRLRRAALTDAESLELARRVAEAIALLHERGIVHRDLKPSNLLLVDGRADRVKVLDFGVARKLRGTQVTRTGSIVGTIGYMAPEQARGVRDIDARADIFALGAVLYRCLVGEPPFGGGQSVAVLAKLVLEEAPRLRLARPDLPAALDELLAAMLRNDRALRIASATEVARRLAEIEVSALSETPQPQSDDEPLTDGERRLFCVILAVATLETDAEATLADGLPMASDVDDRPTVLDRASTPRPRLATVRELSARYGARLELLRHGGVALLLGGGTSSGAGTSVTGGAATDLCARAARLALALREVIGDAPVALSTGLGVASGPLPVGEVVDRAADLLASSRELGTVVVDPTTSGLLDETFELGSGSGVTTLLKERAASPRTRLLLGKPTHTVGREREIDFLVSLFDECVDEPIARAALVVGPAGIGKSRVRYELLRRLESHEAAPAVWLARGDAIAGASPYSLLSQLLRRFAQILDGEPAAVSRAKLSAAIARYVAPEEAPRLIIFLSEIARLAHEGEAPPELRAARRDPVLMGDQMRRAWDDLVRGATRARPLVIVLEDLHWGDDPTVSTMDGTLRALADAPLCVVALARPEVEDRFPGLWREREVNELRLGRLTRQAQKKLVREVLGKGTDPALLERIVDRADGNAFYLEELIRSVAEGEREQLPETVLAMAQARIDTLSELERRVLRAASVFGASSWPDAIARLIGSDEEGAADLEDTLALLQSREILTLRDQSRFPGQVERAFRHALLREAAYAMLTAADRQRAHRLAGSWLEESGEPDAGVLAQHFELGAQSDRAVEWYLTASAEALDANDFRETARAAQRGVQLAKASDPERRLPQLQYLWGEGLYWSGDHERAVEVGLSALAGLPRLSAEWFLGMAMVATALHRMGETNRAATVVRELLERDVWESPTASTLLCATRCAVVTTQAGLHELGAALHERLDASAPEFADDPAVQARYLATLAVRAMFAGRTWEYRRHSLAAAGAAQRAGDLRNAAVYWHNVGHASSELGLYDDAVMRFDACIESARRLGLANALGAATNNQGAAETRRGNLEAGRQRLERAIEMLASQSDRRMSGGSWVHLAENRLDAGDVQAAREAVAQARVLLEKFPSLDCYALITEARVELAAGNVAKALDLSQQSAARLDGLGGAMGDGEGWVRLTLARALALNGQRQRAEATIAEARERVLDRASKIDDPAARTAFLKTVVEHAQTLELAERWLGAR